MRFLLIHGIGFLGTILFFVSYQCKNNKTLFRVQFVSSFLLPNRDRKVQCLHWFLISNRSITMLE